MNKKSKVLILGMLVMALTFALVLAGCPLGNLDDLRGGARNQKDAIQLTNGIWTDGDISSTSKEQWFKFTATTATQYIHVTFGTLTALSIHFYDRANNTVEVPGGPDRSFSDRDKWTNLSVTAGQIYYGKVTSSSSGTYNIAFNTSYIPPINLAIVPALVADSWTDGVIYSTIGGQWFEFTATAATQYLHVTFGKLTDLYVQLYDSNNNTVGSKQRLSGSTKYTKLSVTAGQTYYVWVTPYSNSGLINYITGTYYITFNTSSTPPINLAVVSASALVAGSWTNGVISSTNKEQWFKFTATAATQYLHVTFGTLTALYVQLYDSNNNTIGNNTYLSGSTRYTNSSVTTGQTYYVKVTPYSSSGNGTYNIAFNTSGTPPINWAVVPTLVPELVTSSWADGVISSTSPEQWFKFTATADTQYLHVTFGTLDYFLYVQLYDSNNNTVGSNQRFSHLAEYTKSLSVTTGQTYYIRVTPYLGYSGTYKIAFNTFSTPPAS